MTTAQLKSRELKMALKEIKFTKDNNQWKMSTASIWLNEIRKDSKEELIQILREIFYN